MSRIAALALCCATFFFAAPAFASDSGPPADVAALRAAEGASWAADGVPPKILDVRVVGDYAMLEWIKGQTGGVSAYHRTASGTWKRFVHGGGAYSARGLEALGVPASIAKHLIPVSPG